ncbi:hypothetical protein BT96DRAFT_1036341 [Gymnopus androsaceus JB14]|uniref:F-box domain-containing protein n=1 Tax=Gymnopus androsaceus JB14 TaxID=1447944 RepID=A0A6A4HFX2_9AGAR|nr:hypothetical protein BT96DRAFT_1036341 [Gymnopus androsaceus JB14]
MSNNNIQPVPIACDFQPKQIWLKNYKKYLAKIRYNDIPTSSAEQLELQNLIEYTQSDLQKCTGAFIRTQITKTMKFQESLLSPIRTLPPQILSKIFSFIIMKPIRYDFLNDILPKKLNGPVLTLTWECLQWQNQTLPEPELWSSFAISFRHLEKADSRIVIRLKECILRSKPSGLCLDIDMRFVHESLTPQQCSVLLALTDGAERWKSLKVTMIYPPIKTVLVPVRCRLKGRHGSNPTKFFPKLQYLTFAVISSNPLHVHWHHVPINPYKNAFSCCPKLHILHVSPLHATDMIDLSRLTELTIGTHYMGSSCTILLAKCPLLQTLIVAHLNNGLGETYL